MASENVELQPVDWLLRDRHVIGGLDQLGIQVVSVNLYRELLPGITNVTDRARYYAFYPWVLTRYAQRGETTTSKVMWRRWLRRFEYAYAVACAAFEQTGNAASAVTAAVGLDLARKNIRDLKPNEIVDLHEGAEVTETGKAVDGTYFKNGEGGFAQYYKVALGTMGIMVEDQNVRFPDRAVTTYAGVPLAQAIDAHDGFQRLLKCVVAGKATVAEMAAIGEKVAPGSIARGNDEERMLRSLFFATGGDLCSGQSAEESRARSASLALVLQFVRDSGGVRDGLNAVGEEFRWACFEGILPGGKPWTSVGEARSAWRRYQANDLMNFALESLHWAALLLMLDERLTPRQLAGQLAVDGCRACASLPGSSDVDPRASVNSLIASCQGIAASPGSTRSLVNAMNEAIEERNIEEVVAMATRLLAVLASLPSDPLTEREAKVFERFEVNIEKLRQRAAARGAETVESFIRDLILEWVLFRHLRVATRKLVHGDSTFKFRPEEGVLVAVVDEPPLPTLTMPRLRQTVRILLDLGLLTESAGVITISADGAEMVGAS